MASSVIGALRVNLGLDSAQFQQGLNRAQSSASGFGASLGKLKGALAGLGVALGVGALASMVTSTMNVIDAQAKLARGLGGSTAAVQTLGRAATRAGVQTSELMAASTRLNQRLGEAIEKGKGTEGVFRVLGISAQELSRLDVDERFAAISDRMREAGMSTQQMAFFLRELGIRQSSVINLMQDGGDAIRRSRDVVNELGVALTNIESGQVERAGDALSDVGRVFEGIRNQIAVALAPTISEIGERFTESAKGAHGFRDAIRAVVEFGLRGAGFLMDAWRGLELVIAGLKTAFAAFGAFVMKIAAEVGRAVSGLVDGIIGQINGMIAQTNDVLGTTIGTLSTIGDSEWSVRLARNTLAAGLAANEAAAEFDALRRTQLPSEGIEAFIQQTRDLYAQTDAATIGIGQSFEALSVDTEGAAKRAADAAKKLAEEGKRVFEATRTPLEKFNIEIDRLNRLLQLGAIDWDTYNRAVKMAQDTFDEAKNKGNELTSTLSSGFSSMFEGLISGTTTAQQAIGQLLKSLGSLLINKAFTSLIGGLFGGSGAGAGIGGFLGRLFGGARARGGPTSAGKAYLVGENGPELHVPRAPGMVIPNHALGGMGGETRVVVELSGDLDARIVQGARGVAVDVVKANNRNVPGIVANAQKRSG